MKLNSVSVFVLVIALFSLCFSEGTGKIGKKIVIKKPGKAILGVVIARPDKDLLEEHNLTGGALVKKVLQGSEAEKIGLEKGDIIIEFAGKKVENPQTILELMENMDEGGKVNLTVLRSKDEMKFTAELKPEKGHKFAFDLDDDEIENLDMHFLPAPGKRMKKFLHFGSQLKGGFLGVEVRNLSDQLLEYFEVNNGVLVEKVVDDSPAEKAGLKAGDVITAINGKKVNDYDDLVRFLNYYDPDEKITVEFTRKGNAEKTEAVLAKKEGFSWHGDVDTVEFGDGGEREHDIRIFIPDDEEDFNSEGINKKKINVEIFVI